MSIFASLAGDVRANKVIALGGPHPTTLPAELRAALRWDLPSFDFGTLFDNASADFIGTERLADLRQAAVLARIDTELPLPFPQVGFVFSFPSYGDVVVHATKAEPLGTVPLLPFVRPTGQPLWSHRFAIVASADGMFEIRTISPTDTLNDEAEGWAKGMLNVFFLASFLLAEAPDAITTTPQITPALRRLNAKANAAKGRLPVPPTKLVTIDLGRLPSPPRVAGVPTGRQVTPHDRRAHYRRLPNGGKVLVRACAIKGGGSKAKSYKVAP